MASPSEVDVCAMAKHMAQVCLSANAAEARVGACNAVELVGLIKPSFNPRSQPCLKLPFQMPWKDSLRQGCDLWWIGGVITRLTFKRASVNLGAMIFVSWG